MASETGGTYLPPVVATLVGESGDLATTLVRAKAMLRDFSATESTAKVSAEINPMISKLAIAVQMLVAFSQQEYAAKLGLDTTPFILEMAKLKAEMAALKNMEIGAMLAPYLMGATAGGGGGGGGGIGGVIAGLLGGAGAGGIANFLGFGNRGFGGIPGIGGGTGLLAGFGTIGGLAGFSFEHVLTLTLGLVGSLSEAFAGLGVIAAGTFATMAVGMGSDMLVMKSVIADTGTLYKTLTQLEQAKIQYGAGSAQAAFYTQQLNTQIQMLGNTAGVQAELGLAKLAMTLNSQWDQATSAARVQAVALLTQVVYLAQTYVPLVAEAARRNLAIINTAIMPLFAWLRGPMGMGIFNDLENKFAKDLPTAVDAFNQAIIFLLRFLDLASNYTGGFIASLDRLFTYLNSPLGWARVQKDVKDVIGVFQVWRDFVVILAKDIFVLLSGTVGVGTSVIKTLTGMLEQLHTYLVSTSGRQAIGSLFQAHKAEILALLQLIPVLVGPLALLYLKLAVPLTNIATAMINIINALLRLPGVGPILAYGIAFQILASRMLGVNVAVWAFRGAVWAATAAFAAFDVVLDANVVGIIIIAIIALIAIIVLMITHWKDVTRVVQQVWKDVTKWVGNIVADIGKFFSDLGSKVEKAWSNFAARPGYWIGYMIGTVIGKLLELGTDFDGWFGGIIGKVVAWGANMAAKAPAALGSFLTAVMNQLNTLPARVIQVGINIAIGLWNGIQAMRNWLYKQVEGFIAGLVQGVMNALGSSSPSKKFAEVGMTIPQGMAQGINAHTATAVTALSAMINQLNAQGSKLGLAVPGSRAGLAAASGGRGPVSINMPVTVQVQGNAAATPQGIGTAVQQAISKEFDTLIRQLQGGVYSTPGT